MSKFAKRHYEAIALVMQSTYSDDSGDGGGADVWANIVDELATMFAHDNQMFCQVRFVSACVPGANVRARS
jgi:hypothetical protein